MVEPLEENHIRRLLENKIHFLEELLACSKMLAGLTYENHESEYDSLLETRERCVETLNSIEDALKSEFQLSDDTLKNNMALATLIARSKMLIQEILGLDEQIKNAISNELQNLRMRIGALNCGRKGINGYQAGQRISASGVYTDSRK
jgi:uncharacterized protein YukE